MNSNKVEWITRAELSIKGHRMNDGRTDRQGRFWAERVANTLVVQSFIDKGFIY
ncbi:MAG: hypothetical protein HRT53_21555 [Colwellia sp.]|nr:hypothetical protein [Colwellia sp.]